MNVLTKAFVVVVTVLAVILVALVVPFVAQVTDYKVQYTNLKEQLRAQVEVSSKEVAEERSKMAVAATSSEDLIAANKALAAKNEGLQTELTKALATNVNYAETVERLSSSGDVAARVNASNAEQIKEQGTVLESQLELIASLRQQNSDLNQTMIAVKSKNRTLSTNFLRIQEVNKALVTQLNETKAALDKVNKDYFALAGEQPPQDGPTGKLPPEIKGSVVKIDPVTEGVTFVQINVGTRDQVQKGMEFTVSRGDSFIGTIQISHVDVGEAVGQLTLKNGDIKEGDSVRFGKR